LVLVDKNKEINIEAAAEQWVKLILSQIEERRKIKEKALEGKN